MEAIEAPDWRRVAFTWPGDVDDRAAVVAWVESLGLDSTRLADKAAVVVDGQGRCWLHVDQVYRVAGFETGRTAGPDACDPLDMDRLLTRRLIVEVEPNSWPVKVAV